MAAITLLAPLEGRVLPLEAVPDAVFAERMLGDGIAIDPTGDCLYAPCAGTIRSVQPTGHALTLEAADGADGAEILIHLGLDTVALGGRGFAPQVAAGDRVRAGDPLIRFDLDLLVRDARAVVTPVVVMGERFTVADWTTAETVAVGDPLMTVAVRAGAAGDGPAGAGERLEREIVIPLPHGIHARPAARIAALARQHDATLFLAKNGKNAEARSPTGLLALGIRHGDTVTLAAVGAQASVALAALAALIEGGMDEERAAPPPSRPPLSPSPREVPAGALAGVTAAPGLAVGTVRRHQAGDLAVPERGVGIAQEEAALSRALDALGATLAERAAGAAGPARDIIAAHQAMLEDPQLVEAARAGIARGESAAFAWRSATRAAAEMLRTGGDLRLAERADDMVDLERQLVARLTGADPAAAPAGFPAGTVLVAEDLLPSDLMAISAGTLAGLCVERGGPTSHVAILAASLGLPALVAVGPALAGVADDTRVILDADAGLLHVDPSPERLAEADRTLAALAGRRAAALARAGEPCHTADGTRIELFANLGSLGDARTAVARGAEGCGLLRTEFLFLEREAEPSVEEQAADYQAIADALEGRPLIVRLLDIGGDKPAPYLPIGPEENPALGLRGIRVGLAHRRLLEDQLRAILAVRPIGQCRIMVPMVAGLDELRAVRAILDDLMRELAIDGRVELGVMVETPAAAVTADLLAAEADFLSVGTNDLTQYALAMDRGNAAVAGALDGLHPAVLRLVAETCRGGAARGRWTGVCGGLASDPLAVPILLGLGVTELSVTPALVPDIKALVAGVSLAACRDHAAEALACSSAAGVRAMAQAFAATVMAGTTAGEMAA